VTRQDAAACVLYASEEAMVQAHQAVQAMGGAGFLNDSAGQPAVPRRQADGDRRGHQRNPAHADRARTDGGDAQMTILRSGVLVGSSSFCSNVSEAHLALMEPVLSRRRG
jgi:hypothetical protein